MTIIDDNDPLVTYKTRMLLQRVVTHEVAPWVEEVPTEQLVELLDFIYQTEFLPRSDEVLLDLISLELKLPEIPYGLSAEGRKAAYDIRHKNIAWQMANDVADSISIERARISGGSK